MILFLTTVKMADMGFDVLYQKARPGSGNCK